MKNFLNWIERQNSPLSRLIFVIYFAILVPFVILGEIMKVVFPVIYFLAGLFIVDAVIWILFNKTPIYDLVDKYCEL